MQGKVIKQQTFGRGLAAVQGSSPASVCNRDRPLPGTQREDTSQMHLTAKQGMVLTGSLLHKSAYLKDTGVSCLFVGPGAG